MTTAWCGREKLHFLNPEPINAIADRWISRYDRARVHALADLTTALEHTSMADNAFIYGPRSRASFDIEETGNGVKLTVVHDGFRPGSPVLESISGGWPIVLSGLKTLLEAGDAALAAS